MNRHSTQSDFGAMQLLGMLAGLLIAPVATPALIWATIAADLPLTLVIGQLFVMAVISNWLSRKTIRNYEPTDGVGADETMGNPWSSEPSTG